MINKEDITFGEIVEDNRIVWQHVIYHEKIIAALAQKQGSILQDITCWCQKLLPESEKDYLQEWYIAEDEGFIFGVFKEENNDFGVGKLVEYMNRRGIDE